MEKLETSYIVDRNLKWYPSVEESLVAPWKTKHKITIQPVIPPLGRDERIESRDLNTPTHTNIHCNVIHI